MKVLYVGLYGEGETSKMRGDLLKQLLKPVVFDIIDVSVPFNKANRLARSLAFRYKVGPAVDLVNRYIVDRLKRGNYDLIWVDKAILVASATTSLLRKKTDRLVHFTPDPAFLFHKSRHFRSSLPYYDMVITTKSFEVDAYLAIIPKEKLLLTTQGYDREIHKPYHSFTEKKGVVFVGHYERDRSHYIQQLLNRDIEVRLAGIGWENFAKKNERCASLQYIGRSIFSEEYARLLSSAFIGLGFLSKFIPEKHTTRTFEIPACGTALLTERNPEIEGYYRNNDVIYFDTKEEFLPKVIYYLDHLTQLETITRNGYEQVVRGGYDYYSIIHHILCELGYRV